MSDDAQTQKRIGDTCWYCGGQLCWDNDFDYEDVFGEDSGDGIVTYLHCTKCGAEVQYTLRDEDGKDL